MIYQVKMQLQTGMKILLFKMYDLFALAVKNICFIMNFKDLDQWSVKLPAHRTGERGYGVNKLCLLLYCHLSFQVIMF